MASSHEPEGVAMAMMIASKNAHLEPWKRDVLQQALDAAERDALPSDVLVQFLRRSLRARLLARGGDVESAEHVARAAVAIASQTDALCSRARAHFALAEVLELAGDLSAAHDEQVEGNSLLRRKGAKGALVGAPSA
jgi:hypothetical protein